MICYIEARALPLVPTPTILEGTAVFGTRSSSVLCLATLDKHSALDVGVGRWKFAGLGYSELAESNFSAAHPSNTMAKLSC